MATEFISSTVSCQKVEQTLSNAETQLNDNKNISNEQLKDKNCQDDKKKENHQHHRRKPSKKKRKWKPYTKMTWEEKKAVEERETARADRIRGEMLNRGRPVAPYNTTQFIMAEHDPYEDEPIINSGSAKENDTTHEQGLNEDSVDDLIEAEYTDSPHMAPEFISQDFREAYERVQEESLSTMTRDDLVKEHLSLERTLSYLQGKLAEEKTLNNSYSVKVQDVEEELDKLRRQNKKLVRENVRLRFGKEAADDLAVDPTSDYEYEVPISDNDVLKYSEDYNDVDEHVVMNEEEDGSDSSLPSPPLPDDDNYEPDEGSDDSGSGGSKHKKLRHVRERDAARRRVETADDTNSSYEDNDPENNRAISAKLLPSCGSPQHKEDFADCRLHPSDREDGKDCPDEQFVSSKVDFCNDESMQSLATPVESMDGQSYPMDEKGNSVSMQSFSSEN